MININISINNINPSPSSTKILEKCNYPLTGKECVNKIITDIAVMDVIKEGILLREVAPEWNYEMIQSLTEVKLIKTKDIKTYKVIRS